MPPAPAPPGLWARLSMSVQGWVRQILAPVDVPFSGSLGGSATPVWPQFSQARAMSALAAHPWVRACVRARCDDVGGLPLLAVQGTDAVTAHPFLSLIRRPSPGVTETVLRRQLEADLTLTGNAYLWLRQVGDWWELHRLHPEHVHADVKGGVIVAWNYGDRRLSVREVWHVHDVSWSDDLSQLYGESPIRTLDPGLRAVLAARKHATASAGRGRPDIILRMPVDSPMGAGKADDIADALEERLAKGRAVSVIGGGAEATPVTWSPKDVEFPGLDTRVRDETLAVLRVPPTRAGVPQSNYATAKAELRDYWGALVVSDLRLLEDAYTAIAHVVGGSLDVVIRHDISSVEALQSSYDQRQARAGFWVTVMGATPKDAASYEGFRDAPVGGAGTAGGQPASRPRVEVDDQPNRQAIAALTLYLASAAERLQGGDADRDAEALRIAGVLEAARYPDALELAAEVAPIVCETAAQAPPDADLSGLYVFGPSYAERVIRRGVAPRLALAAK